MSLDTWEGSLAKIPRYRTHLNISKGENSSTKKLKMATSLRDSKIASPLLSSMGLSVLSGHRNMLRHAVMKGASWRGILPRETLSVSPVVAELMHVPFFV